jgi:hypothetical protein
MFCLIAAITGSSLPVGLNWTNWLPAAAFGVWPGGA